MGLVGEFKRDRKRKLTGMILHLQHIPVLSELRSLEFLWLPPPAPFASVGETHFSASFSGLRP